MPYTDALNRLNSAALQNEEVTKLLDSIVQGSVVLSMGNRLPDMSTNQQRMPILESLPTAYFRNPVDTGLGQTTKMAWTNKYINAEELVVFIPIPNTIIEDSSYDLWGQIQPRMTESAYKVVDLAVLFGTNAPASWPTALVVDAIAKSKSVQIGSVGPDIVDDIGGEGGLMALVEASGFDVNGFVGDVSMKSKFRGLRDANGGLIFQPSVQAGTPGTLYGQNIMYSKNGGFDATTARLIAGDFKELVYSLRRDITFSFHRDGVIQDSAGNIIHNLMQQGMTAVQMTMRLGWNIPNVIKSLDATNPYPFSVLIPA